MDGNSQPLPGWWVASAVGACIACVALFGLATVLDSLVLGFTSILVLLVAATGLPWLLHRHQRKNESESP